MTTTTTIIAITILTVTSTQLTKITTFIWVLILKELHTKTKLFFIIPTNTRCCTNARFGKYWYWQLVIVTITTQLNSQGWLENYFTPTTTWNSMSIKYQRLLTRFRPNFKRRFRGSTTTTIIITTNNKKQTNNNNY